jgi:hypothetical protein
MCDEEMSIEIIILVLGLASIFALVGCMLAWHIADRYF